MTGVLIAGITGWVVIAVAVTAGLARAARGRAR